MLIVVYLLVVEVLEGDVKRLVVDNVVVVPSVIYEIKGFLHGILFALKYLKVGLLVQALRREGLVVNFIEGILGPVGQLGQHLADDIRIHTLVLPAITLHIKVPMLTFGGTVPLFLASLPSKPGAVCIYCRLSCL